MEQNLGVIFQHDAALICKDDIFKLLIVLPAFLTKLQTLDAVWLSDQLAVLCFGAYPAQLLS